MGEITRLSGSEEQDIETGMMGMDIAGITEDLLTEARAELPAERTLSVPIGKLAALGGGAASLIPALRTVTQTATINTSGLYQIANQAVGDTLKAAKNGDFWGAIKAADGTSKMAQLQAAGPLTSTATTLAPISPATIMMAVALYSIEQKLDEISEMQKRILSFLEIEKEAEIEADVETLSGIITKYKYNWDNEQFVTGNHKLVLDIQRTARKNMLGYQKKVSEIIGGKKPIVGQTLVNNTLRDLVKKFRYYRLSLYTFSMASMMEIMLSGNFKEEYIAEVKTEIETMSVLYRDHFEEGSVYIEKISVASVEKSVISGLGSASKAVGKLIGSIPIIKEGPVDEFLIDGGTHLKENAQGMEDRSIRAFAEISNPKTRVFTEQLEDMIRIYKHTEQICFDDQQIYLITA